MARLDGTKLGPATVVALAFTAACSSSGVRATGTTSGGGHGGAANQGGSTASSVASTSVVTVGTGSNGFGGSGGSGGAVAGCNPPAAPGSLWELDGLRYPDFQPVSMCQYRGDVTLIVNTAAI